MVTSDGGLRAHRELDDAVGLTDRAGDVLADARAGKNCRRAPVGLLRQSVFGNGHFGCTCYHPLFVFNQFGDRERCALRPGNVHSANEWEGTLRPVIARYQDKIARLYFRADAAFAMPEMCEFLEAEGIKYTIRLPANRVLQDKIGHLLARPVGRPPNAVRRFHASFSYQAQSWKKRATSVLVQHPPVTPA